MGLISDTSFVDSVIFRSKRGTSTGLKIHPTIFGYFSNEIDEDEEIQAFSGVGSKNYAYETRKKDTGEVGTQVVKIRGLTLSGDAKKTINLDLMRNFVHNIQEQKNVTTRVPQFRIRINGVSKKLSAKDVQAVYSNFSNHKRFYHRQASLSRLWPFGVTEYI